MASEASQKFLLRCIATKGHIEHIILLWHLLIHGVFSRPPGVRCTTKLNGSLKARRPRHIGPCLYTSNSGQQQLSYLATSNYYKWTLTVCISPGNFLKIQMLVGEFKCIFDTEIHTLIHWVSCPGFLKKNCKKFKLKVPQTWDSENFIFKTFLTFKRLKVNSNAAGPRKVRSVQVFKRK